MSFLWGAATSSHQIEGHNDKNDWWAWEHEGHIEGGARSGAATDHWHRFREDLDLAAQIGLNSYRFSIEWSRLEPEEDEWNDAAFEWYRQLILECEKRDLVPMLTLHHFTSPLWFAKKGGFTWSESPQKFAELTRQVVRRLGSRVPLWCTINEPMVLAAGTYLGKFMPPAQFAPKLASKACENLLRSHVAAYDIIHSELKEREGRYQARPLEVGIAHNMLEFIASRRFHPIERVLQKFFHGFYNASWLKAVTGRKQNFGVPFLVPRAPQVQEARGRCTVDFIGVNYYTKAYVQWAPKNVAKEGPKELPIGLAFAQRQDVVSDLGWAMNPAGFRRTLEYAASFGLPLYVTENGIADREDKLRPEYLSSHLKVLADTMASGVEIRGYYYWSLLDNFEWIKGFGPRFGLYQVDYETFERTPTRSAMMMKQLIEAHHQGPPNPACWP
jgi:beta-glucosidase